MTVWWELAKPTSLQAGVPSVTSAAAGNVSNPLHTHTHKHKYRGRDKLAFLRSQQTIVTCSLSRRLTG